MCHLSVMCLVNVCCYLSFGIPGNKPWGRHGPQSSEIVLAVTMSCLIKLHICVCRHTHTQFDKVLKGGCRVLVAQSYGVWSSGKYPTHTLNNGHGERETADLEEQILVFTGPGGFTCSALFLFQTRYICVVEDAGCFGSFSLTQSLSCLNLLAS